jgi:hypothetical protein
MLRRHSLWFCAVGLVAAAASARAGDVDKYLPDDTEMVVAVNVRQIVESDLFKKNVEAAAREALKNADEIADALKDLGLDPFTDVDRVIAAMPSGADQDRGLVIAHGRFDLDKFRAKGEQAAKDQPDVVKIHKVTDGDGGKFTVYEVRPNVASQPVFLALPDKTTVLASPGKDYVVDAMRKGSAKEKPALKNKEIQGLLEKMNDKQGVSLAIVGSALTEGAPQEVKDIFEKVDAVGGGVTITDEIKIEIAISAKDADDAKDIGESVKGDLKQVRLLLSALAFAQSNELDALLDVVNSIKISVKDKTVVVKGAVSADVIDDALKKDK